MAKPREEIPVIYRRFKRTGEAVAFLPSLPANPGMIESYMKIGQHGEACRTLTRSTIPASLDETDVHDLHDELCRLYGSPNECLLVVRKRVTRQ